MVSIYSEEQYAEIARRKREGILTLSWYVCHNCGWEAWISDGVRSGIGCGNSKCYRPILHVHSDIDGEKPRTLKVTV